MDISAMDVNEFRDEFSERLSQLLDELVDDDNHLVVDVETATRYIVDEAAKLLISTMMDEEE